jgi:hypothetical protein
MGGKEARLGEGRDRLLNAVDKADTAVLDEGLAAVGGAIVGGEESIGETLCGVDDTIPEAQILPGEIRPGQHGLDALHLAKLKIDLGAQPRHVHEITHDARARSGAHPATADRRAAIARRRDDGPRSSP